MIEARNVSHHYGVRPVLRNINLHIAKGELVVLMGPNGMGKSTLLGVLAGAISPTSGSVIVDGKIRRSTPANELAIRQLCVYLPAEAWLPLGTTGRQWLLAVGRIYSISDDRLFDHIEQLLDLFDLKDQADASISSYSTGQRRKISVAAALVTDAPVMFLDEPFSGGLDPSALLALKRVLLYHISSGEKTIIIATPVPELVEELALPRNSRVGILKDGVLIVLDTLPALSQQTAGLTRLEEIYEKLVGSKGAEKVDRYLTAHAK